MALLEILKSILMGIVQGITEWLPISSTGHMLLLDQFIHMTVSSNSARNKAFFDMFLVVIQLGSILAVLVLYFHKLNPFSKSKTELQKRDTLSLWGKVLVACVPAGIIGVAFNDLIDTVLYKWYVIAVALIVYGILFIWLENRKKTPRIHKFSELNYKTALLVGVFQMLALIPGTSRSGSTILGAVFLGSSRYIAAEFSFFLAIPVMFGASGVKLLKFAVDNHKNYGSQYPVLFSGLEWAVLLVGFFMAFLVSVFVIRFLINYIKKHDFKVFGYYRIILGILVILYFGLPVLINALK